VEHNHGPIGDRDDKPYGNGVLLWFEVDDFDAVMRRADEMRVEIVLPRHRNPPEGSGGPFHRRCWMRDPDGYIVVVSTPYELETLVKSMSEWKFRVTQSNSTLIDIYPSSIGAEYQILFCSFHWIERADRFRDRHHLPGTSGKPEPVTRRSFSRYPPIASRRRDYALYDALYFVCRDKMLKIQERSPMQRGGRLFSFPMARTTRAESLANKPSRWQSEVK
jgi:hypothetical protein